MATSFKSTSRVSYQRHNNLKLGHKNSPKPVASPVETRQINEAIVALSKAKQATTEAQLIASVTDAFRLTRQISRSRIL